MDNQEKPQLQLKPRHMRDSFKEIASTMRKRHQGDHDNGGGGSDIDAAPQPPSPHQTPSSKTFTESRYSLRSRSSPKQHLSTPPVPRHEVKRRKLEADDTTATAPPLPPSAKPSTDWQPSLVIGESLGENLSPIEAADRRRQQWEAILAYHKKFLPGAVATVEASLKAANKEYMALLELNAAPTSLESTAQSAVAARLKHLESVHKESAFHEERDNIWAAIRGYKEGLIPASDTTWTIIYAGRIVDKAESYAEFSFGGERAKRLDKYFAQYGRGFLWYEGPLLGEDAQIRAGKGLCLRAGRGSPEYQRLGRHMTIKMAFRRVEGHVSRGHGPLVIAAPQGQAKKDAKAPTRKRGGKKGSGPLALQNSTSPILCYSMLLDTGATWPGLYDEDFRNLGIDRTEYAAQSLQWVDGFAGKTPTWLYDMEVGILYGDDDNLENPGQWKTSLPEVISATIPVMLQPGEPPKDGKTDMSRLSSGLPWEMLYTSSAPTKGRLWLGLNRHDVLGADKIPAGLQFNGSPPSTPIYPRNLMRRLGPLRKVTFEHEMEVSEDDTADQAEKETLRDEEDTKSGKNVVKLYRGEEEVIVPPSSRGKKTARKTKKRDFVPLTPLRTAPRAAGTVRSAPLSPPKSARRAAKGRAGPKTTRKGKGA